MYVYVFMKIIFPITIVYLTFMININPSTVPGGIPYFHNSQISVAYFMLAQNSSRQLFRALLAALQAARNHITPRSSNLRPRFTPEYTCVRASYVYCIRVHFSRLKSFASRPSNTAEAHRDSLTQIFSQLPCHEICCYIILYFSLAFPIVLIFINSLMAFFFF